MKMSIMANKAMLYLKEKSPEILLVAGIAGVVTGTVLACKATTKAKKITDKLESDLEIIQDTKDLTTEEEYSDEDIHNDKKIIYTQAVIGYAKAYAPAAAVLTASVGSLVFSHGILRNREKLATAAYASVSAAYHKLSDEYNTYRNKVDSVLEDKKLRNSVSESDIYKDTKEEKNSKGNIDKSETEDSREWDEAYRPLFSECSSDLATKSSHANYRTIKNAAGICQRILDSGKWLTINDARTALGMSPLASYEAMNDGWVSGDIIDFGIDIMSNGRYRTPEVEAFINNEEPYVELQFNAKPNIKQRILKK